MAIGSVTKLDKDGNEMVECRVCAGKVPPTPERFFHSLAFHVKDHGMAVADYKIQFPGAPVISALTAAQLEKARAAKTETKPVETTTPESAKVEKLNFGVAQLPIRADADLSAIDKLHLPEHDPDWMPDDRKLEQLALAILDGENVLLVGPTGCGKTTIVKELGALLNQPIRRVNMNGNVRASSFIGEKGISVDPKTNQAITSWRDGVLIEAMEQGHWLLVDEIDAMPPQVAFVMQAVLEGDRKKQITLPDDSGRVVTAHANFRIIATANTIGKGDDTGLYTGTNVLNEAFLDRFGSLIEFDYLSAADEAKIIIDKTKLDKPTVDRMVEAARLVREGARKEECFCTFSLRRLLYWARKTMRLRGAKTEGRHMEAAQITVLSKLGSDDRKYVTGIIERVMGKK